MNETVFVAAIVVTAVATAYDTETGRIPNWLTVGSLVLAIVHAFVFERGTDALLGASLGGGVPLVLTLCYPRWSVGGGDIKLLAAIGALLGPVALSFVVVGSLFFLRGPIIRRAFAPALLGGISILVLEASC